jgi:excisionase family DNA binding protein
VADSSAETRQPKEGDLSTELLQLQSLLGLDRKWINLSQLSRLVGVSYPTVASWQANGKLQAVKVNGRYRVYMDELKRFLVTEGFARETTINSSTLFQED